MRMDRAIAAGMNFYAAMSLLQISLLIGVANLAVPHTDFEGAPYRLVKELLWLQAVTAPCFGISVIASSVLQAARRYDFVPRWELAVTVVGFAVLVIGVRTGINFFWVAAAQSVVILILRIGPALWVMVRELGFSLHFHSAEWADYRLLGQFSFYMALIQISFVFADKIDSTILGFMLSKPGPHIAVYDLVSKPFLMLRQTGATLASLVIPAVTSLAAAHDHEGLERVKYDGTRLHAGVLLPVGLLAWIYARPFLSLWFGHRLGYDAAELAPLMRLFLVATIPLVISVPVQIAIGLGKARMIAVASLTGSLVNLPLSCLLTARLGVAGVIWGSVLTTLFSNLLVPGIYSLIVLEIKPLSYLQRSLAAPMAGAVALVLTTWGLRYFFPVTTTGPNLWTRMPSLIFQPIVGTLAYIGGYLLVPAGRGDLFDLLAMIRRRVGRL